MKFKRSKVYSDEALLSTEVFVYSRNAKVNASVSNLSAMTVNQLIDHFGGPYGFKWLFLRGGTIAIWDQGLVEHLDAELIMVCVRSGKLVCPRGVLTVYNRVNRIQDFISRRYSFPFYKRGYRRKRKVSIISELREAEAAIQKGVPPRAKRIRTIKFDHFDKPRSCNSHHNWKRFRKTQYKD